MRIVRNSILLLCLLEINKQCYRILFHRVERCMMYEPPSQSIIISTKFIAVLLTYASLVIS